MTARIDQDDEVYNVTVGDTYLGTMVEDSDSEFGLTTEDEALQPELADFTMAYKEAIAVDNLPAGLHDMYGENLIAWTWTDDKDLKIIVGIIQKVATSFSTKVFINYPVECALD